jgi:hypothetical protein
MKSRVVMIPHDSVVVEDPQEETESVQHLKKG